MSRALYQDIYLTEEQLERVRQYITSVDFHLPGATSADFTINSRARYLGYMFQAEHLEAFGVGLRCTAAGMEHHHTFIRMSRGQLLGEPNAPILPVNPPVLAAESMTLNRFYEAEGANIKHGVDTYSHDAGLPGADMDLAMMRAQLDDIVAFYNGAPVPGNQEILDLKIFWGSLLAGRYPRLKHFEQKGQLSTAQSERLGRLEGQIGAMDDILRALELPTLESLTTKPKVDG